LAVLNSAKVACCGRFVRHSRVAPWRLCDFALTVSKKNTKKAQQVPNPNTRAKLSRELNQIAVNITKYNQI